MRIRKGKTKMYSRRGPTCYIEKKPTKIFRFSQREAQYRCMKGQKHYFGRQGMGVCSAVQASLVSYSATIQSPYYFVLPS